MKAWQVFLALDAIVLAAAIVAFAVLHGGTARTVRTGVVLVDADLGHGARTEGTGIVITRSGEVLTNNHVIEGAISVRVKVPETGRTYNAEILGYDVRVDAALLKLHGAHGLRTASVTSPPARLGQRVLAVGGATGAIKFAVGHVTGLQRSVTAGDETGGSESLNGLIEFDAGVQPGDSGGPLLDLRGDVLGVDTAGGSKPGLLALFSHQHDSFAIPIATALGVAHAIEGGHASSTLHIGPTAFLGIELDPMSSKADVVRSVHGSPAAAAGLDAGARITAADGRVITAPQQIVAALLEKHPGDRMALAWTDRVGSHAATIELVGGPAL